MQTIPTPWISRFSQLVTIMLLILLTPSLGNAQGKLMNKLVSKIAKKAGAASTITINSLDNVVPTVGIASNIDPAELGTLSQSFFSNWKTGGDQILVMLSKRNEYGFCQVDGKVTVDGMPAEYVTTGMYTLISDPNPAPRKVEITTSTGQKTNFTITPSKRKFKLISVNGVKDNPSIDLTQDVTLEIDGQPESTLMKVSLTINQVGIKSTYDVCFVRSGSKLVVPAAAFRNISIKPAGDAAYSYKDCYLTVSIEESEKATDVSGAFKDVVYTSYYTDGKYVTITKEPVLNPGLSFKVGESVDFNKPSAFTSRPFSQIKKVGVISFSMRGTTFQQVEQSASKSPMKLNPFGGASTQTTVATVTFTKEFPWEAVLDELYPQFVQIMESEFNAEVLPIEKITTSQAYQSMDPYAGDESLTKVQYAKPYKSTKVISAFRPLTESYGANNVNQRVMNETGADALLTITLDLETVEDGSNNVTMTPKFGFEIAGRNNGVNVNTQFASGIIKQSAVSFNSKDATAEYLANSVVRKAELVAAFRRGLQELKAKEKANGDYEIVWGLQK
jgi:hypothetical protein